jgi:hypothetical protein
MPFLQRKAPTEMSQPDTQSVSVERNIVKPNNCELHRLAAFFPELLLLAFKSARNPLTALTFGANFHIPQGQFSAMRSCPGQTQSSCLITATHRSRGTKACVANDTSCEIGSGG